MLKMRSEMMKTKKKRQNNQVRENFPGISRIARILPENFYEKFPFLGKLKIREKGNPRINLESAAPERNAPSARPFELLTISIQRTFKAEPYYPKYRERHH